jgi:hypothetical protein
MLGVTNRLDLLAIARFGVFVLAVISIIDD